MSQNGFIAALEIKPILLDILIPRQDLQAEHFAVTGVDLSLGMLYKARVAHPDIAYLLFVL